MAISGDLPGVEGAFNSGSGTKFTSELLPAKSGGPLGSNFGTVKLLGTAGLQNSADTMIVPSGGMNECSPISDSMTGFAGGFNKQRQQAICNGEDAALRSDLMAPPQEKSFVQALNPYTAAPVRKGEFLSVNIDDQVHKQGVRDLQNSIIGRIILRLGAKPISTMELKALLDKSWNINGNWKIVSLGRGFFNIQMADLKERDRIFLKRSWP